MQNTGAAVAARMIVPAVGAGPVQMHGSPEYESYSAAALGLQAGKRYTAALSLF